MGTKSNGGKPAMRIKLKGKNDAEMTATNRDGSTYRGPQVEFITVWENDGGRLSGQLAKDFGITYKGKPVPDAFINIYQDAGPQKRESRDEDF